MKNKNFSYECRGDFESPRHYSGGGTRIHRRLRSERNFRLSGKSLRQRQALPFTKEGLGWITLLEQIADDNTGIPSIKSRNILCFVYELCEEYPGNPSDTTQHKSTNVSVSPEQILNRAYTSLEVSPNPATYYAEFSWEILNLEGEARIEIYDLSGKIMASHCITVPKGKWAFDTRNLVPGTYPYSLTTHDTKLAEGKLTIQK